MKKSLFSGFILLLLGVGITISFQNCGEVGGTSPFNINPDDNTNPGGQQTGNLLNLRFTATPTVQNRILTASLYCDYSPFTSLNHVVSFLVTGPNNYQDTWTTNCTGSNFTIQRTMLSTYNAANSYTITAVLTGIANNGEVVSGGINATATITIGQGTIYPASTDLFTQNFSSLADNGVSRDVTLLNAAPANYYPYTAIRGKLEFRVASQIPQGSGLYYGIFELLPYQVNSAPFSEYNFSVSRFLRNSSLDVHQVSQIGLAGGASAGSLQEIPSFTGDTRKAFELNKTYVIDFVLRKNGTYYMTLYEKTSPGTILYYANASLEGFLTGSFGTDPIIMRLGKGTNSTAYHSGFTNIILYYRACGYINGLYDTSCSESSL